MGIITFTKGERQGDFRTPMANPVPGRGPRQTPRPVVTVAAFIGPPTTAGILAGEHVEPKVWPIRLAFYSASSAASEPDVEVGMMLQANGVARHLTLDYDNFAIDGRLDKLEILPAADC